MVQHQRLSDTSLHSSSAAPCAWCPPRHKTAWSSSSPHSSAGFMRNLLASTSTAPALRRRLCLPRRRPAVVARSWAFAGLRCGWAACPLRVLLLGCALHRRTHDGDPSPWAPAPLGTGFGEVRSEVRTRHQGKHLHPSPPPLGTLVHAASSPKTRRSALIQAEAGWTPAVAHPV